MREAGWGGVSFVIYGQRACVFLVALRGPTPSYHGVDTEGYEHHSQNIVRLICVGFRGGVWGGGVAAPCFC